MARGRKPKKLTVMEDNVPLPKPAAKKKKPNIEYVLAGQHFGKGNVFIEVFVKNKHVGNVVVTLKGKTVEMFQYVKLGNKVKRTGPELFREPGDCLDYFEANLLKKEL